MPYATNSLAYARSGAIIYSSSSCDIALAYSAISASISPPKLPHPLLAQLRNQRRVKSGQIGWVALVQPQMGWAQRLDDWTDRSLDAIALDLQHSVSLMIYHPPKGTVSQTTPPTVKVAEILQSPKLHPLPHSPARV